MRYIYIIMCPTRPPPRIPVFSHSLSLSFSLSLSLSLFLSLSLDDDVFDSHAPLIRIQSRSLPPSPTGLQESRQRDQLVQRNSSSGKSVIRVIS